MLICTSVVFNHNSTAANHITGNARWIILSDPIACSSVAINYNFGTQLICLRAGLVIWFCTSSLDFPYPLISFALAHQQHQHMLSHPHPRAHLTSVLLIPKVAASASLTHSQSAGCHSHSKSLHLSFSGSEPLNLSTLHLTALHKELFKMNWKCLWRLAYAISPKTYTALHRNLYPFNFFFNISCLVWTIKFNAYYMDFMSHTNKHIAVYNCEE